MTLNTNICLAFMYITSKISISNLKLIDNLIVSPDTSTVYGEQALTDLTTESESFWIEAANDCLRATSNGMISDECRHTNYNSYIQI
jgi:hypothetical protein